MGRNGFFQCHCPQANRLDHPRAPADMSRSRGKQGDGVLGVPWHPDLPSKVLPQHSCPSFRALEGKQCHWAHSAYAQSWELSGWSGLTHPASPFPSSGPQMSWSPPHSRSQPLTVGENQVREGAEAELGLFLEEVVGQGPQQRHTAAVLIGQGQCYPPDVVKIELLGELQSLPRNVGSTEVTGECPGEAPSQPGSCGAAAVESHNRTSVTGKGLVSAISCTYVAS